MAEKDLQVQEKQEVQTGSESTRNVPIYVPPVDIYESENALTLLADMPGVSAENVEIDLKDNQLTLRGQTSAEGLGGTNLFREFEVGDYYRQFTLASSIDQSKIEASMKNGVLTVVLPKVTVATPRKIAVNVS